MIYPRVGHALTDCNPGLALGTHDNLRRFSDVAPCRLRCRRKPYRVHVVPRVEMQNKGDSMKYKSIAILIFCASVAPTAFAQSGSEEIGGAGTPNFIARFTGTHKVGNSNIFQSPNGNIGIGTTTPSDKFVVFNTDDVNANGIQPVAIYGTATSSRPFSSGIRGDVNSGAAVGVVAVNYNYDNSSGGGGVTALIFGTTGFTSAIRGSANGTTGNSVAVFGEQFSPYGQAGLFINRNGGDILHGRIGAVGQDVNLFRVDGTGRVFADGGFQPNGADFAESMAVTGDRAKYAAGDLLVIDPTANRHVALAQQPYSTLVAGIYSTKPGLLGTSRKVDESAPQNEVPLAVVGIVPCKVTAENGPIQIGDLLVTSSIAGHAMKGTDRSKMLGAVVGKALEPLPQGTGVIQVLVTLQ